MQNENQLQKSAKDLDTWYLVYWICIAAGVPLSIFCIGIFGLITAVVFYCLILYKLWELIPADEREKIAIPMTPGKAVGFSFIPIFNLFWCFLAFLGLAKCLNVQTKENLIEGKQVSEGFALVVCILYASLIIPYLNLLTMLVMLVFQILTVQQMKDAGIALIQKQIEST